MSHFRSVFRQISANNSYQVSNYGPRNSAFYTFLPSDIAGLSGWWDANDNAYLTGSGNNITVWSNKGTAGGYISGSGGGTMTSVSGYKNTRQAIYFKTSSVNSYWETSVSGGSLDGSGTKCWFLAFQSNPHPVGESLAGTNAYYLPPLIMERFEGAWVTEGVDYPAGLGPFFYFGNSNTGYTTFLSSSSPGPVSGSDFILNAVAAVDTTSPYSQLLTMSINGSSDKTIISTNFMRDLSSYPYGINSSNPTYLNSTPHNRYIYEILFYTGTLTSAERTQIINYLNDKWAIY